MTDKELSDVPPSTDTGHRHRCSTSLSKPRSDTRSRPDLASLPAIDPQDSPIVPEISVSAAQIRPTGTAKSPVHPGNCLKTPSTEEHPRSKAGYTGKGSALPQTLASSQPKQGKPASMGGPVKSNRYTALANKGFAGNPPSSATGKQHRAFPKSTHQPRIDISSTS